MAPRSAPPLGPRKHVRRSLIVSPGFQLRALLPLLTFLVLAAALLAAGLFYPLQQRAAREPDLRVRTLLHERLWPLLLAAEEAKAAQTMKDIHTAQEAYCNTNGAYAPTFDQLKNTTPLAGAAPSQTGSGAGGKDVMVYQGYIFRLSPPPPMPTPSRPSPSATAAPASGGRLISKATSWPRWANWLPAAAVLATAALPARAPPVPAAPRAEARDNKEAGRRETTETKIKIKAARACRIRPGGPPQKVSPVRHPELHRRHLCGKRARFPGRYGR